MDRRFAIPLAMIILGGCPTALAVAQDDESARLNNWHHWRGPSATGVAPRGNPPLTWDATTGVKWRTELPGEGSSTPIVWGDRVFVLAAVPTGQTDETLPKPADQPDRPFGIKFANEIFQFMVVCLDRDSGAVRWQQVACEKVPFQGHHQDNDFASASPTTDGRRLYVPFGSQGYYCYDLDGKLLWQRDLGPVETRLSFGEGSSLVVHGDRLILVRDNETSSYIMCLDAATGETRWRVERDEISAWATPLIVTQGGRTQVVTNASKRVRSYDLETGELLWECGGQVSNVIPSPVASADLVFCMSGYRGNALYAIPLASQGDLTDTDRIAWKLDRGTPYVPSPLLLGEQLWFTASNAGILSCVQARTGEVILERTRLPGISGIYASPVAAGERIYLVGRDGTTLVIRAGNSLEVLATNKLNDTFHASPAIVGGQLFLRGRQALYCLEE